MKNSPFLHLEGTSEAHQRFGRNLVRIRTSKQLTQEALAEKAEISLRYLQSLEAGKKRPSINVAVV